VKIFQKYAIVTRLFVNNLSRDFTGLGESFPIPMCTSNEFVIFAFGVDTAKDEPPKLLGN